MAAEVMDLFCAHLDADAPLLFLDATLGAGGHAKAILSHFTRSRLIGFDQDEQAREIARQQLAAFGDRVVVVPENFSEISGAGMINIRLEKEYRGIDGTLFDLGVSNMQLTTPERGFSYQESGPLDMRMDPHGDAPSALELLETLELRELTRIFREYGEERFAYQIAKAIVRTRERSKLPETTEEFTALIRQTLPAPVQRKMGGHPARRVFQALRIAVNRELDVLREGLQGALREAAPGAVIVVISYHSLEDRIVKRSFLKWADEDRGRILTRRPILPGDSEIESNRSSRSAKLRAFIAGENTTDREVDKI